MCHTGSEDTMKRRSVLAIAMFLAMIFVTMESSAQFRDQQPGAPRVASSIVGGGQGSSMFSWFNPENFNMSHSYTMSYMTMGGRGLALGMYTSSMQYQISDPLDVQLDVSVMHSPYSSFHNNLNDLSGVFISRAQVNYQPTENFRIQVQYRQMPHSMYGYGSPFYNPWFYRYGY